MQKKMTLFTKLGFLLVLMATALACQAVTGVDVNPVETASATQVVEALPTATRLPPTPTPTQTPLPTQTPFPTPAAVGERIEGDGIYFTVVDAYQRGRIYPGGAYSYTPNPGYMAVDVGVRIQNQTPGTTITIPWRFVGLVEDNGDGWYPLWGSVKYVASGVEMDAMTIGISEYQVDGDALISLEYDAYLRMIFIVQDTNEHLLFNIGSSPDVELTLVQK